MITLVTTCATRCSLGDEDFTSGLTGGKIDITICATRSDRTNAEKVLIQETLASIKIRTASTI